jgi:Cu(I)/Ag(I) efflux system membrane protein CusA/SilA
VLRAVPGTSSAYAERGIGGYYLEVTPDRSALSRYGIMVQDVQDTIGTALGGQTVTTTVEGRQRFTVNVRYPRDLRDNPKTIASDILVPMPGGGAVPLGEVAKVRPRAGRPRSGPRTGSSRPTSMSISATAISAAMSPTRRPR